MQETGCFVSGCGAEQSKKGEERGKKPLMEGIDVSKYQGDIDWIKVKEAGIGFAICRASFGRKQGQVDPTFIPNVAGARAAGLAVGAYHYSYATAPDQARQEAELFYQTIRDQKLDMPVYLDMEDPSQAGLSKEQLTEIAEAFCAYLAERKYFVGVYANLYWLEQKLELSRLPYTIWLARWAAAPGYQGAYGLWQYSSKGQVAGINGFVDRDAAYQDFPALIRSGGYNGFSSGENGEKPEDAGSGSEQEKVKIFVHCRCCDTVKEITGLREGNSIYGPVRSLGEALGCQVEWKNGQVHIYG